MNRRKKIVSKSIINLKHDSWITIYDLNFKAYHFSVLPGQKSPCSFLLDTVHSLFCVLSFFHLCIYILALMGLIVHFIYIYMGLPPFGEPKAHSPNSSLFLYFLHGIKATVLGFVRLSSSLFLTSTSTESSAVVFFFPSPASAASSACERHRQESSS